MPNNQFVSYGMFATLENDGKTSDFVGTASSLEEIKKIFENRNEKPVSITEQNYDSEDSTSETKIGRGLWDFYRRLNSYYELSEVLDYIPDIFMKSFFNSRFVKYSSEELSIVGQCGGHPIYGLTQHDLTIINTSLNRWDKISEGFSKLSPSILLSLVAIYDSAFSDFVNLLLRSRPERYAGSERQYSVSDILKLGAIDDIIQRVVDDEVDQLMRKSHDEQIKFFESNFHVSVRESLTGFSQFIEVFERRNLAAHGNLIINDIYLNNSRKFKFTQDATVGDVLIIDSAYLEASIDILLQFGVIMSFSAWQKQVPQEIDESYNSLIEISYALLREGRPRVVDHIVEFGLNHGLSPANDEQRKMLVMNQSIAKKDCGGSDEDVSKVLMTEDWSAASPKFKLCRAAVLEELDTACDLLEAAKVADNMTLQEIREWPAFKWMRKDQTFDARCLAVFGESIIKPRIAEIPNEENE